MQNLFGEALGSILSQYKIRREDFATASTIDRTHLPNIFSGRTRSPTKIAEIFIALTALRVSRPDVIRLAILWLEDRRTDAGFTSTEITIHKTFGNGESSLPARDRLISLYDNDADIRTALDIIVDSIMDETSAVSQPRAAAEHKGEGERSESSAPVRYKTTSETKRGKRK